MCVPPEVSLPLRRLGDYDLIRQVARGGMADIYLARRAGTFARPVALKVLRQRPPDKDAAEACQMFLDKADGCTKVVMHP